MSGRAGRRPGSPDTRGAILAAASELFARKGFDGTSVRAVAAEAGVDSALVHHYFGTKRDLFLAAVAIPVDPAEVLAPLAETPLDEVGEQLLLTVGALWEGDLRHAAVALLKSTLAAPEQGVIRGFLENLVLAALAERLGGADDDVRLRVSLVATQMLGFFLIRYVVEVEPLASLPLPEAARLVAPGVQRYLTGEL
ncbi:TetR family transcriptional regulator [Gordonia shandongensis]|uniref:TetR/AcrR family transcriptional regulator n=1 Tax=Gordonia shandongensis TaxID=376351 RepID=UPI00041E0B67|nr:TetR family transcriptional regulator [Gordonia shandongensis]